MAAGQTEEIEKQWKAVQEIQKLLDSDYLRLRIKAQGRIDQSDVIMLPLNYSICGFVTISEAKNKFVVKERIKKLLMEMLSMVTGELTELEFGKNG